MKVPFARKFTYIPERISALHTTMFHGELHRPGNKHGLYNSHAYDDDLSDPIFYTCNGYNFPEVAFPVGALIVSRKVMELTKELPGLKFGHVLPKKIIYYPYEVGDYSFYERSDVKNNPYKFRFDNIFEIWPARRELELLHFPRFEIVYVNDGKMAKEEFPEAKEINVPDPTNDFGPKISYYSEKMLEKYSIVGDGFGLLFSPGAFSKLEPFLNPDYFDIMELEV